MDDENMLLFLCAMQVAGLGSLHGRWKNPSVGRTGDGGSVPSILDVCAMVTSQLCLQS